MAVCYISAGRVFIVDDHKNGYNGVFVMSKELEPTEGSLSHVQHNLNVCCQRLSMMMVKKMNYDET